jgi:hypothetical protein
MFICSLNVHYMTDQSPRYDRQNGRRQLRVFLSPAAIMIDDDNLPSVSAFFAPFSASCASFGYVSAPISPLFATYVLPHCLSPSRTSHLLPLLSLLPLLCRCMRAPTEQIADLSKRSLIYMKVRGGRPWASISTALYKFQSFWSKAFMVAAQIADSSPGRAT